MENKIKAEGKTFDFLPESEIKTEYLQTFDFLAKNQKIIISTSELSAVCPFSGLPDIAELTIEYKPITGKCIELKSLKYYLTSFRNVGIYQEALTNRIYVDLLKALGMSELDPCLKVITKYNTRGGINTTCIEGV